MQENAAVLDYLQLYLTDNVFDHLVTETNRFAEQFMQDNLVDADNSYTGLWVPVTHNEMKKFIGLVLLMGIIYKPTVPLYWSTDEMFATPIFSQVMSHVRFQLILKFLHFNDNEDRYFNPNDENHDRLHKLQPFLELMRNQMRTVFTPGRELSVDESLVLFKGGLKFRQFIHTKRARFGIKRTLYI